VRTHRLHSPDAVHQMPIFCKRIFLTTSGLTILNTYVSHIFRWYQRTFKWNCFLYAIIKKIRHKFHFMTLCWSSIAGFQIVSVACLGCASEHVATNNDQHIYFHRMPASTINAELADAILQLSFEFHFRRKTMITCKPTAKVSLFWHYLNV